jgi:type II secretory pathway component PulK
MRHSSSALSSAALAVLQLTSLLAVMMHWQQHVAEVDLEQQQQQQQQQHVVGIGVAAAAAGAQIPVSHFI